MSYRVLYREDMSAADKQAFHQWASEEFEWMDRLHFAQERAKAEEHDSRVQTLRASSLLRAERSRGTEDVTVAEKSSSQKVRAA